MRLTPSPLWHAAALALGLTLATAAPMAAAQNLQALYEAAKAYDAQYLSAITQTRTAELRLAQSEGLLKPSASVTAGATANNTDLPRLGRGDTNSLNAALQGRMPLFNRSNSLSVEQARKGLEVASADLQTAEQDLIVRVAQAYFDVLGAQDDLTAIEASKKAVSEQLAQARREFEVGTKTIVDTHEAQARFDQIVAQEQVVRGTLIVRQNTLRSIIGRDPGALVPLTDKPQLKAPQPLDVDSWARQAEEGSFPVQVARLNGEIAKIGTKLARNGHMPTVDLVASLNQNRSDGSASAGISNTTRTGVLGVQLNVPVYSGGLTQSRIREALAIEDRTQQDLEAARRNASQSAKQAYTGVDFGLAQVRALESAEVSARSQLESTRLGYQVGVRINLDVLNATTQLFATQRDLKKSRYEFLINGLRLESATGGLDEQDVQAVNTLLVR